MAAALATDTGLVRDENQDRAALARGRTKSGKAFTIAAIADGIGGMSEGAACASNALAQLISSVFNCGRIAEEPAECLAVAVRDANNLVYAQSRLNGGTTLVAILFIDGSEAVWTSIGDSRLYRASGSNLAQLSKDDTIAGQLGRHTDIELEQSKLLQFVGIGENIEISVEKIDGRSNEIALLTTDGVHFLERSGGVFGLIVQNAVDVGTCAKRLTELARWAGGPDNASVVAIPLDKEVHKHAAPDSCLDVWDPFGEIRIVETRASITEQDEPASPNIRLTATEGGVSERPSSEQRPEERESPAEEEKAKRPKRKKKSSKKTELTGTKTPQVQLHFSGKDD